MKVRELIEQLKSLPQEQDVYVISDGEPRIEVNLAYESKKGAVILSNYGSSVYSDEARPICASSERYWETQENPIENEYNSFWD